MIEVTACSADLSCFDVTVRAMNIVRTVQNSSHSQGKQGNDLFNNALDTFYLRLYGVGHMIKDHSDSERKTPLPPLHGLFFPISSKGSFICIITHT